MRVLRPTGRVAIKINAEMRHVYRAWAICQGWKVLDLQFISLGHSWPFTNIERVKCNYFCSEPAGLREASVHSEGAVTTLHCQFMPFCMVRWISNFRTDSSVDKIKKCWIQLLSSLILQAWGNSRFIQKVPWIFCIIHQSSVPISVQRVVKQSNQSSC
jgi:hypothetical protein